MGWFKVGNTKLVISDASLDCCTGYLKLIFKEFEEVEMKPCLYELMSMQEILMSASSYIDKKKIGLISDYIDMLTCRTKSELPGQREKSIEEYLKQNLKRISQDYHEHLERKPLVLEVLAVFLTALTTFESKLVDPEALRLLQAKILKEDAG